MNDVNSILTGLFHSAENLLFPQFCSQCGKLLSSEETAVCRDCLDLIDSSGLGNWIMHITTRRNLDFAFSVFWFDRLLQELIHLIKYQNRTDIIQLLTDLAAHRMGDDVSSAVPNVLIPVPLHPVKYRERGFNQAELIARRFGRFLKVPVNSKILTRKHWTRSQTQLSAAERRENTRNAFAVKRPLDGKRVLLIDDVLTTGATASAGAAALKRAGASWVGILTLCTPRIDKSDPPQSDHMNS